MQFNRRDLHLFRHMVFMLSIFVIGWSPIYILLSIQDQFTIDPVLVIFLTVLCQVALLCDIIELYVYNRELRNFYRALLCGC